MKLNIICEGKTIKYYKVVVGEGVSKPEVNNIVPGYLTQDHNTISGYLSAFISSSKKDDVVWVIEADIDIGRLEVIDDVVFGYKQNKSIMPGYYGTETSPDDGINNPLDVIVWNEPIDCRIVGGYIPSLNYELNGPMNSYKNDGNAWRDAKNGVYTFDDIKNYYQNIFYRI